MWGRGGTKWQSGTSQLTSLEQMETGLLVQAQTIKVLMGKEKVRPTHPGIPSLSRCC